MGFLFLVLHPLLLLASSSRLPPSITLTTTHLLTHTLSLTSPTNLITHSHTLTSHTLNHITTHLLTHSLSLTLTHHQLNSITSHSHHQLTSLIINSLHSSLRLTYITYITSTYSHILKLTGLSPCIVRVLALCVAGAALGALQGA